MGRKRAVATAIESAFKNIPSPVLRVGVRGSTGRVSAADGCIVWSAVRVDSNSIGSSVGRTGDDSSYALLRKERPEGFAVSGSPPWPAGALVLVDDLDFFIFLDSNDAEAAAFIEEERMSLSLEDFVFTVLDLGRVKWSRSEGVGVLGG